MSPNKGSSFLLVMTMKSRKQYTIDNLMEYYRKTRNETVKAFLSELLFNYSKDEPRMEIWLLAHVISELYTANRAFIELADNMIINDKEELIKNYLKENQNSSKEG